LCIDNLNVKGYNKKVKNYFLILKMFFMSDKNCGMCTYFKYRTKENWARSGLCKPPSGIKYNKDFFNEICDEFSRKSENTEEFHDMKTCPVCSQEYGAEECCPFFE